jgi:DNA-3-methyladenine glycosylase II
MSTNPHAAAVRHLSRRCPTLKSVIARVGACTWTPATDDPFTLIVRCIISQQISGKAAESISGRLIQSIGKLTPRRLANFTDEQFQACGVSGPKRRTLRAICEYVQANRKFLPGIPTATDDALREQLVSIKGIGPWTVDMFLMFAINRPDILPVGDYGVKVGIHKLFGLPALPKPAEMERIAEPWRPYRSVASWYIWRSLEKPKSE